MLSQAQSVKERASIVKATLENSQEELIDTRLCSADLEKVIKELKRKISQDESKLPEWKKVWAREWEEALWDS